MNETLQRIREVRNIIIANRERLNANEKEIRNISDKDLRSFRNLNDRHKYFLNKNNALNEIARIRNEQQKQEEEFESRAKYDEENIKKYDEEMKRYNEYMNKVRRKQEQNMKRQEYSNSRVMKPDENNTTKVDLYYDLDDPTKIYSRAKGEKNFMPVSNSKQVISTWISKIEMPVISNYNKPENYQKISSNYKTPNTANMFIRGMNNNRANIRDNDILAINRRRRGFKWM